MKSWKFSGITWAHFNCIFTQNPKNYCTNSVVSITSEIAVHDSPLKAAVWQVYDSIFSENQGKLRVAGGVRQSRRRYTAGNRLLLKPLLIEVTALLLQQHLQKHCRSSWHMFFLPTVHFLLWCGTEFLVVFFGVFDFSLCCVFSPL